MRFYSFMTLTLAAGIAVAADGPKSVTYLNGNIEGFSQNADATLELRDTKVMVLRAKGADAEIPFGAVSKTERTEVPVVTQKDPLYKVWSLHKRLLIPTPLQKVMLTYTENGAPKTVTMEMEKSLSDRMLGSIERAAERNAANAGAWWGDGVWKTKRNKDQWGGLGTVAQRE